MDSKLPEKVSGERLMRELVAQVAGTRSWSDTRESWLSRAARRAGISYRQTKALFYGEIADPNHKSARLMRDAAELAGRYESIAHALGRNDADFHSEDIAALLDLARSMRAAGGPKAEGG